MIKFRNRLEPLQNTMLTKKFSNSFMFRYVILLILPNCISLRLLGSIWCNSEISEVPYSTKRKLLDPIVY